MRTLHVSGPFTNPPAFCTRRQCGAGLADPSEQKECRALVSADRGINREPGHGHMLSNERNGERVRLVRIMGASVHLYA